MENQAVDTLALAGSANYDMSIWGLFLEADIVVKLVLVLLLAASFWTWAVIFEKIIRMRRLKGYAERYEEAFWSGGSSAPFIGLFGTVWGIMNSFTSIAASENTSLAVVAPGIAEALFATALGLVAAIPAVLGFNKLSGDLNRYAGRLEAFAGEFGAIMSRQLDER